MSTYENNETYLNEDPLEFFFKKIAEIAKNADKIKEEKKDKNEDNLEEQNENKKITTYEQIEEYLPKKNTKEDFIKTIKDLCNDIDISEKSYNDLKKAIIDKYGKETLLELNKNKDIKVKSYIVKYYEIIEKKVSELKTREEFIEFIKNLCKEVDKKNELDLNLHLATLDKFGEEETDKLEGFDREAWEAEDEEEEECIDGFYFDENGHAYKMINDKKYMGLDYWAAADCLQIYNIPFYALNEETNKLTLVKDGEDMQNAKTFDFYITPEDYEKYIEAYEDLMRMNKNID